MTESVKTGEPVAPPTPGDELRLFPYDGLRTSIERAVAAIPEGKTFAAVAFVDLTGRARIAAMVRLEAGWSFAGILTHSPARGLRGEAGVLWSR